MSRGKHSLAYRLPRVPLKRKRNGCILWGLARDRDGYGRIRTAELGEPYTLAHRLSWMLHHGAIPDGMHVLHRCDEPACVAIEHLWLGTHAQNMADRDRKGRAKIPVRDAGRWTGEVRRVG